MNLILYFGTIFLISATECSFWGLEIADFSEISNIAPVSGQPIEIPSNFTILKIVDMKGTIYPETFSKFNNVKSLVIARNQITEIKEGAICSSSSLRQFEIDFAGNDNIVPFNKEVFRNCENLEEFALILNYEITTKLADDTFENLPQLKKLILRNHRIGHLKRKFLKNLKSLTHLSLFGTFMEEIDDDVFENFPHLEELSIDVHQLTRLPKKLLRNVPKLVTLSLTNGNLTSLKWDEFEGLGSLKSLYLTQNRIVQFDAEKIVKYMPNLQTLTIMLNPAKCKVMEAFAKDLQGKMGHPVDVAFKYDPGYYDECLEKE